MLVGFRIPKPGIPYFSSKIVPDFGFHKQNFPDSKIRLPFSLGDRGMKQSHVIYYLNNSLFVGCSQNRRLKFSPPVKDNYLQGHVFFNISFEAHISCEAECLHRKECVAINIGPTIKGIKVCELCNSDHLQHPNDLEPRRGWTYRGTQVG